MNSAVESGGDGKRRVFGGGKFDKMNSKGMSNVFGYDPGNKEFDDLLGGLDGEVSTIFCSSEQNSIIFGGSFKSPVNPGTDGLISSRYLGSLALWNETSKNWFPLKFGGLNGSVSFISSGLNSSSLRFGGAFDTSFSSNPGSNPNNAMNASMVSGTNRSSSALTSVLMPLSLGQSEFTGGPPIDLMGFDDPAQILCPQGEDGPDNSYLFADEAVGRLTVRTFRPLDVRAIRLGNTFYNGRGTKTFGIVSIPDNTPLELRYLDPITDRNMTCTNNCTLSNDTSIPYQDFLISETVSNGAINGSKALTGIEFTAYDYYGDGAGLHALELLSDGAWAYAYGGYNRGGCSSSEPGVNGTTSTSTSDGGWYQSAVTVNNALGGTVEATLSLTDDYSNLAANQGASVTWNVDVPVNGNYSIYMFIPGCQALNECGMRTSVDVTTISNASSTSGNVTRVSQVVQEDTSVLVYDGEIQRTSSNFTPSVILSLPADAPAPSDGGRFTVIADKITFLLRNSNETFQLLQARGFGVLEFDEFDSDAVTGMNTTLTSFNGTGTLPNSTISDLGRFSTSLLNAGVRGNETETIYTIMDCADQTFVGGNFSSDTSNSTNATTTTISPTQFANLVFYNGTTAGNQVSILPGGGLNSAVYSLASVGDDLYIGGNFTSTLDNSTLLNYFAMYSPKTFEWSPIMDGPVSAVTSIVKLADETLLVAGTFNFINSTGQVGGYGVYDTKARTWSNEVELLVASIDAVSAPAPGGDDKADSWLAGKVTALSDNKIKGGAAGLSEDGDTGDVIIKGLNFSFKGELANGSNRNTTQTMEDEAEAELRRRFDSRKIEEKNPSNNGGWFNRARSALPPLSPESRSNSLSKNLASSELDLFFNKKRQTLDTEVDPLPLGLRSNGANELLTSAYWAKPGVSDVNMYPRIVGGNFTTTNGVSNVGYYDPSTGNDAGSLIALPTFPTEEGMNISVVRTLLVVGNILYVGGDGGLVTMDLSATPLMWRTGSDSPATLSSTDGDQLAVISMLHRPETDTVVVSGVFDRAGSLPCAQICDWDQGLMRWSGLGSGVQGQIEALDYAVSTFGSRRTGEE